MGRLGLACRFVGLPRDNCGAAQHYAEAQALKPDPKIADALTAAQVSCALTPTAAASGTPGILGAPSTTATPKSTPNH